jgi:ubiquinone/menaquinone biosynthesis C-methylase UbiE
MKLLEVGCGTAPILVAAASSFKKLVGVDIAFRWLVVAKKRLADVGLDIPLICACAEALPFPDGIFDRVVFDSVVEVVKDQRQTMSECHRVMRPAGYLYVTTPNRHSIGPDPHTGMWAGSFMPSRLLSAYVRFIGGIPPVRRLLSANSLARLIRDAGFSLIGIELPNISEGQFKYQKRALRILIKLYQIATNLPICRQALKWIGPLLHATAQKPRPSSTISHP